jgi:hypothetical protein
MQPLVAAVKRRPEWRAYLDAQQDFLSLPSHPTVPITMPRGGVIYFRTIDPELSRIQNAAFVARNAKRAVIESLPEYQALQAAAAGKIERPVWTEAWELLREGEY